MYKLLIVDDNDIQVQSLLCFVEWEKFGITEIQVAQDGQEGLELFASLNPDIIITDIEMPILNGIEMTKKIREKNPDVKIIFISCYEDFHYLQNAMENEVVSYILKPIDRDELTGIIERVIAKLEDEKKYQEFHQIMETNLLMLRENFLYRLLYSHQISYEDCAELPEKLKMSHYHSFMMIKLESEKEESGTILRWIQAHLLKKLDGIAVIENLNRVAVLLMSEEEADAFYQQVHSELSAAMEEMRCDGLFCRAGVSAVHSEFFNFHTMPKEADSALWNNLADENNIACSEKNQFEADYTAVDMRQALEQLAESFSAKQLWMLIDAFCPDNPYCPAKRIQGYYVAAVAAVQMFLLSRNMDLKTVFGDVDVMWHKQDRFSDIKTFRQWLYNILNAVMTTVSDNERDSHDVLVSDIVNYINQNYSAISNVEQISKELFISSSYARSIFKKYIGKTIFEYLTSVRMDEAKHLLANPNAKVYEVAERVGYKSKPQFVTNFKQYVGMNPKEFQQEFLKKEQ